MIVRNAMILAACLSFGCSKGGSSDKPAKGATAPAAPLEIKGRRIDVKVTKTGYEPASIPVKKDEQVTLVFTRLDEGECGAQLVVPSIDVKKDLPIKQPVAIPMRPDRAGALAFACGMDMMHGEVLVTD